MLPWIHKERRSVLSGLKKLSLVLLYSMDLEEDLIDIMSQYRDLKLFIHNDTWAKISILSRQEYLKLPS